MPELVNAVGGGDLGKEIDLEQLSSDLEGEIVRYDPEYWPGIYFKFTSDSPTILIFSSGKYNIAGASSIEELYNTKEEFLKRLEILGLSNINRRFETRNLVYLDAYGKELNLESLAIALGLEYTEYEPEQFPGLLYKPAEQKGTFLIFRTGKILHTGSNSENNVDKAFRSLFATLDELFN